MMSFIMLSFLSADIWVNLFVPYFHVYHIYLTQVQQVLLIADSMVNGNYLDIDILNHADQSHIR